MTSSEDAFPDRLSVMFATQLKLQRDIYLNPLYTLRKEVNPAHDPERVEEIQRMILALEDELHEALNETGWKPWATSRHINVEAFKGELVDVLHFFLSLCLLVGVDDTDLYKAYLAKAGKNIARQSAGYDGVDGKCRVCKRALDDVAVTCTIDRCVGMVSRDGWGQ